MYVQMSHCHIPDISTQSVRKSLELEDVDELGDEQEDGEGSEGICREEV